LEDFSSTTQKNPRAEITHKKYRKQIDWRRNKVRELLIRGYSQYEISNTLHLSQPTISRDIGFIRKQNTSAEKRKNLAYRYYYEQQNALDGVGELMKNLWLIIDNPKIQVKERMKAMNLIMHCYYMRSKLLKSDAINKEFLDYTEKVKRDEETNTIREQEISRREKSLERALDDHLKNGKLTKEKIWEIRDPNAVF
jgi:predicted transcriptional regulator